MRHGAGADFHRAAHDHCSGALIDDHFGDFIGFHRHAFQGGDQRHRLGSGHKWNADGRGVLGSGPGRAFRQMRADGLGQAGPPS